MRTHWIWLAQKNMGSRVLHELLSHFGSAEAIFDADGFSLAQVPDMKQEERLRLLDKDTAGAEEIIGLCLNKNVDIVTLGDAAYPKRLKEIYSAPLVLYVKGTLPDFERRPAIGMVGTRNASAYGLTVGTRLGYQIGRGGGMIVSGLSKGVDAACVQGALLSGCPVAVVLGTGIDKIYPMCNKELFRDVERFGCLISEYPPEAAVNKWHFSARNRIISGLSNGVVVVEAPEGSGALITAARAAEQGRDVFAVPGNVDSVGFVGSNRLLHSGATAVSCGWDILSEYSAQYRDILQDAAARELPPMAQTPAEIPAKVAETVAVPKKKSAPKKKLPQETIDIPAPTPYIDPCEDWKGLNETEKTVMRALSAQPRLLDDVIAETGIPAGKLLAIMTLLELKSYVLRHPGRRVSRKERK